MKLELTFSWKDIERSQGERYCFPDAPTSYMKRYREPGVYRWAVFSDNGNLDAVYVGEAEDLQRRLKDYLSPGGKPTASRIARFLWDRQAEGKEIRFQAVVFEEFAVNLCHFDCLKLTDPFARKVIENLLILEALRSKYQVLNKGIAANEKKINAAAEVVSKLPFAQQAKLIRKLGDALQRQVPL